MLLTLYQSCKIDVLALAKLGQKGGNYFKRGKRKHACAVSNIGKRIFRRKVGTWLADGYIKHNKFPLLRSGYPNLIATITPPYRKE